MSKMVALCLVHFWGQTFVLCYVGHVLMLELSTEVPMASIAFSSWLCLMIE